MKTKISLVQPNFQQGPKELNSYYLPYSVGVIWSYAAKFEEITNQFELDVLIWQREDLDETAERLATSDIVGFSTYIWNRNYNYALAKRIKEKNPDCLIILGGPEPPITKLDMFEHLPFVDLVVKQEGEITFKRILDHYKTKDFENISGLVINKNLEAVDTGMPERISELAELPSPYTTGVFDKLVAENPIIEWNATLETNRGCPFQCFTGNTKIITSNCPNKKAKNIQIGDKLIGFDEETKKLVETEVFQTVKYDTDEIYIINFQDGTIIETTEEHPFYVNGEWKETKNLCIGDEIYDITYNGKKIISIAIEKRQESVYNFECSPHKNFFAEYLLSHNCTFCDWGSLTYSKVKKFGLEKINEELEWIGKNKCGFVSIADANFGMFVERDNLISDKIIEVKGKYGFPYTFGVNWAKNQKNEVVDLVKKISKAKLFAPGLTVSVQSMDEGVLENIKRKNLGINKIESIFQLCDLAAIPVVTELILGLPGETLDTWRNNFWRLFDAGNHTGVEIFQAQLLENAEMNLLQRKLYKLKSTTVYDYMSGSYNEDEIAEGVDAVISTSTLSLDKMVECQVFSWFINTLHIQGLSTYLARFTTKYANISYKEFYQTLFDMLNEDPWFRKERETIEHYYRKWMDGGRIDHPPIGGISIHGWNLIHRTLLNIHANNEYDVVFGKLKTFISTIIKDEKLAAELIEFQASHIVHYPMIKEYPLEKEFTHDILGYIQDDSPNLHNPAKYAFVFPEENNISLAKFLELIYFGRRRGFGKTRITKSK